MNPKLATNRVGKNPEFQLTLAEFFGIGPKVNGCTLPAKNDEAASAGPCAADSGPGACTLCVYEVRLLVRPEGQKTYVERVYSLTAFSKGEAEWDAVCRSNRDGFSVKEVLSVTKG